MAQQTKSARSKNSGNHSSNGNNGSAIPSRHPKAIAVAARASCPVCLSRDRIEKVSNIVRNGRGKLVWEDGEVSHYETELSGLLDEPEPPKALPLHKLLLNAVPSLLILVAILGVINVLQVQTYLHVPESSLSIARNIGLAWFGALVPLVLVVQFVQSRLEHRREMPRWVHARRRWTALYYCSRDDIVFTPALNIVASPTEMNSLLYPPDQPTEERVKQIAAGGLWEATTAK